MATSESAPVVVFLSSSIPQPLDNDAEPPLALKSLKGALLLDQWWSVLEAAGYASAENVYFATNARYYKYFEYWAFGKGIALPHIINSGRTLGDSRVEWRTVSLALRCARKGSSGERDIIVISADSAPPSTGLDLAAIVAAARAAGKSALLLQPGDAKAGAATSAVSPTCIAATAAAGGAGAAVEVATVSLTTSGAAVGSAQESAAAASAAFAPLFYVLAAKDAGELLEPSGEAAVVAAGATGAALPKPGAVEEAVVPVEAVACALAARGRLVGVPIAGKFAVGAMDGTPHGLPAAEAAKSQAGVSPYAHALPLLLATARTGPATHARGFARVGLLGNPSDGYAGKTMSVTIANFAAEAWITPVNATEGAPRGSAAAGVTLVPHPVYDPLRFPSLGHLSTLAQREGYSGGVRLMTAALNRFAQHCASKGVVLPPAGFTARYHTTVPRQVGLAGSSAIVTAFLRAVMEFYGFGGEEGATALGLSRDVFPNFVLAIEFEELGITAGLQDRVVQAYESAVHMDFTPSLIAAQGHGTYTRVPVSALPPLFLAYAADPSDSGRIHAPVKQRWLAGDKEVVDGMNAIAALADAGLALANARPYGAPGATAAAREAITAEWATLFAANFNNRRRLFGDGALGRDNIRMVEIARENGASGKFPGSGGAIIGVVDVAGMEAAGRLPAGTPAAPAADAPQAEQDAVAAVRIAAATEVLRAAYHAEGYVFTRLQPHEKPKA